jgi:hypothetical protein
MSFMDAREHGSKTGSGFVSEQQSVRVYPFLQSFGSCKAFTIRGALAQ